MRPWIWMLAALTAGALAPAAPARADARDELLAYVLHDAERDFEAVREEAALSGSAPLAGLKAAKPPAKKQAKPRRARSEAKLKAESKKQATSIDPKPAGVGRP